MSAREHVRRELRHPASSPDMMRRIVVESLPKSAAEVLKQCSLHDVLALALDHPAVRDECRALGVKVNGADVAFASRDFPACIQGYILDSIEAAR